MLNLDFTDCKTSTAIKNKVREAFFSWLREKAIEEFGADRVSIVFKGETTTKELSVGVQDIKVGEQLAEICVNLSPVVKDYEDRTTAKKTIHAYERLCMEDEYNEKQAQKQEKKKKEEADKMAKIERDKKAREKRKAEKEKDNN